MFLYSCLLIILILVISCWRWYIDHLKYWSHHKTIPSLPGLIFNGRLKEILTFKTNFAFDLRRIYEDPKFKNDAVVGVFALNPVLLVRDPELIKSILIRDFDCFRNRVTSSDPHHDPIGARLMFFARYNYWKDSKTKLSPIFTTAKIKQIYPSIQQVGEHLEGHLEKRGARFVCEIKELTALYAIDIISTTVFGIRSNSMENPTGEVKLKAQEMVKFDMKRALNFLILSFAPKLNKIVKARAFFKETEVFLRNATRSIMRERENSGALRNDMVDIFIKLKQEAASNGEDMEVFMDSIASHTAMFIAAGFETSSAIMSFLLLELSKHPEVQKRVRQEILERFERGNGSISYEDINNMEYLSMCMDESLRMYPVFPMIERQYLKPHDKADNYSLKPFYDYDIPDGMGVYISTFALHYDPQYWQNPTKFDPERFSPENKKSINPMIYLPFGGGPRYCIGARLGQIEVKACIAHILKNHYVQPCAETVLKTEYNVKAFLLQAKGGLPLEMVRDDLYTRTVAAKGL